MKMRWGTNVADGDGRDGKWPSHPNNIKTPNNIEAWPNNTHVASNILIHEHDQLEAVVAGGLAEGLWGGLSLPGRPPHT